jgi:cell pole-organizing protein PopZ
VPLTAKIAALGAAIGKSPQEWEPDGDEASDLSAHNTPSMAWEDDVELDAKGAPLRSAAVDEIDDAQEVAQDETDKDPVAAAFGGDDQLMDEEALRELVAEIVRTELQGALGERITRNVRKLVRREIHRALTAQELE